MDKEVKDFREEIQDKIVTILNEIDKKDRFSTIVNLPTGTGKTKTAMKFLKTALEDDNNRILWFAYNIEILKQARKEFKKNYEEVVCQMVYSDRTKSEETEAEIFKVEETKLKDIKVDKKVIFGSILSFENIISDDSDQAKALQEWLKPVQHDGGKLYIIFDEVHHIGAEVIQDIFKALLVEGVCKVDRYALVGLTATVYRGDKYHHYFNYWFKDGCNKDGEFYHSGTKLMSDFGKEDKVRQNTIDVTDITELLDENVLAAPTLYRVDDFKDGVPKYDKQNKKRPPKLSYLVKKIKKEYKKWGKTIIFVDSIDFAEKVADSVNIKLRKEVAFAYTSDNKDEVKEIEKAFRENKEDAQQIMIVVDMVSEGYDCPDLNTVYLFAPIMSHIILRQRVGRVLRNLNAPKKCQIEKRVIWQYYPKDFKEIDVVPKLGDNIEQKEDDIKLDVEKYKSGEYKYLPAGMYLEPLPSDSKEPSNYSIKYEFLEMLKVFTTEELEEANAFGWFDLGTLKIYVRDVEKEGYEQFYRMIFNDYLSEFKDWYDKEHKYDKDNYEDRKHDFPITKYAKVLDISLDKLLEEIKIICFGLSHEDVKKAANKGKALIDNGKTFTDNGKVRKGKGKIRINSTSIINFFNYVVEHNMQIPLYYELKNSQVTPNSLENATNDSENVSQEGSKDSIETPNGGNEAFDSILVEHEKKSLAKVMEDEELSPATNLREAIELYNQYQSQKEKSKPRKKVFTENLSIKDGDRVFYYPEIVSARTLMNIGAIHGERLAGKIGGTIYEKLSLVGMKIDGSIEVFKSRKSTNEIGYQNLILIANALITHIDHIRITEEDIKEYKKCVASAFQGQDLDIDRLTYEFLMALGYAQKNNDFKDKDNRNHSIIRMQCELFGKEELPKILQYVIYERIYDSLYPKVEYDKYGKCINKNNINSTFKRRLNILNRSGKKFTLPVVEDVIYDYRPYLKALDYYQGIKTEYLCRLTNQIVQSTGKKEYKFINAFGGSGVNNFNFFTNPPAKTNQVYNEYLALGACFYEVCKDNKLKTMLIEEIGRAINCAYDYVKGGQAISTFFKSYTNVYSDIATDVDLNKTVDDWHKDYLARVGEDDATIKDKLKDSDKIAREVFSEFFDGNEEDIHKLEKAFHCIVTKAHRLYSKALEIKTPQRIAKDKVNLAFLFFVFNSFAERRVFHQCKFSVIIHFINNYKEKLDLASKLFKNVEVLQGDANILLTNGHYNKDGVDWYLDIPYAETDVGFYASDFKFDEFYKALNQLEGKYIVSSRFNICINNLLENTIIQKELKELSKKIEDEITKSLKDETQENVKALVKSLTKEIRLKLKKEMSLILMEKEAIDEISEVDKVKSYYRERIDRLIFSSSSKEKDDIVHSTHKKKKNQIFDFYGNFCSEAVIQNVEKWSSQADKKGLKIKQLNKNQARYILIPITNKQYHHARVYKRVDNNGIFSIDSVRRMFAATAYSNIPVEVMITNTDIKPNNLPVHEIKEGKAWLLPTFETPNNYLNESLTLIMDYQYFFEEVLVKMYYPNYQTVRDEVANKEILNILRSKLTF